jgi:diguanylate cyclase
MRFYDGKSIMTIVQRLWIPLAAALLTVLLSVTVLHQRLDSWVQDRQQWLMAEDYFFTDTVILDIDDESLQRLAPYLGSWPFSRGVYATLLDYLNQQGVSRVVFDILFAEARADDEQLRTVVQKYNNAIFVAGAAAHAMPIAKKDRQRLHDLSWQAVNQIPAVRLNSLVLPRVEIVARGGDGPGIGVVTVTSDSDGLLRRLPLLYRVDAAVDDTVDDALIPSLPLSVAAAEVKTPILRFDRHNSKLFLGERGWPVDDRGVLYVYYPHNANSVLTLPFADVVETALGLTHVNAGGFFHGKTVYIGSTAYLSDRVNTPRGHMSGTYLQAIAHETMARGLALKPEKWSWDGLLILIALCPLFLMGINPFHKPRQMLFLLLLSGGILFAISFSLFAFLLQKNSLLPALEIVLSGSVLTLFQLQSLAKKENVLLEQENMELNRLASIDPLTSLYNRRAFQRAYSSELERIRRYSGEFPVIALFDLDHFKNVNDTYGHDVGDEVLKVFSRILRDNVRSMDVVSRWGGEEFTVLLPSTSREGSVRVLNLVREVFSREKYSQAEGLVVTVSIGAAIVDNDTISVEEVMKKADEALYEAKESGRNRVCVAF